MHSGTSTQTNKGWRTALRVAQADKGPEGHRRPVARSALGSDLLQLGGDLQEDL
ncbi:MAG: hypothetical protein H5T34_01740 [Candidatus Methanomethyliales bacterium]|nr:hypothetical protein [Candidatus Methanomethylicales archaeon]